MATVMFVPLLLKNEFGKPTMVLVRAPAIEAFTDGCVWLACGAKLSVCETRDQIASAMEMKDAF